MCVRIIYNAYIYIYIYHSYMPVAISELFPHTPSMFLHMCCMLLHVSPDSYVVGSPDSEQQQQ